MSDDKTKITRMDFTLEQTTNKPQIHREKIVPVIKKPAKDEQNGIKGTN